MEGLTKLEAVALCSTVREQNHAVLSSPTRMQCWQCLNASEGDPDRMYMSRMPGFLGCDLMNKLRARAARARSL
jgi:hypothetical protein